MDENIQSGFGLLPEGSVEQARQQGKVWLSGQLSGEDSLVEVLELLEGAKLKRALLRILSKSVRGYVAIENSTTISGAHVSSSQENGYAALEKLLAATKGIFLVMEVDEHPAELQQSMKLSVSDLLRYRTSDSVRKSVKDALATYANEHPNLFAMKMSPTATASNLASFETYLAWGEEDSAAPAPPTKSLAKITQQIGLGALKANTEKKVEVENILDRVQSEPEPDPKSGPGVIVGQGPSPVNPFARLVPPPVPPSMQNPPQGQAPQPAEPAPPPPVPPSDPQSQSGSGQWSVADLDAIPAPGAEGSAPLPNRLDKPTTNKLIQTNVKAHRDDDQSVSQRISVLRDDPRLSQRLKAADADFVDDGPIEQLNPAEQRKRLVISLAMGTAGFLLFVALGHQVFTITTGFAKYKSGVAALKAGDNARAQVELTTAIKQNDDPRAYFYRAVAESRLGHKEDALKDFNVLIGRNPNDRLARLGKATLLIKSKAFEQGIQECDELLKRDPGCYDGFRLKSLANCMAGKYKEAIDDATSYLNMNPPTTKDGGKGKAEVLASRGFSYLKVEKFEQAVADFTEALKYTPQNAKILAGRAVGYGKLKAWSHALSDVKAAIELDPANASLYKLRGQYYSHAGDAARAAADLDRAAKMLPSVDAFRLRGIARMQAKDYEDALQDFEYLLSVNPNDKDAKAKYDEARAALAGKGKTYASLDLLPKGDEKPAVAVIKGTPEQLTQNGYAALKAGKVGEAINLLSVALKAKPNDVNARRYLAYAFARKGDHDSAITQFSSLAEVLPYFTSEDSLIYGKELFAFGKFAEAAQVLNPILSQQPRNDEARQLLINSLLKAGLSAQAVPLCDEGMSLNPTNAAAYAALKKTALSHR